MRRLKIYKKTIFSRPKFEILFSGPTYTTFSTKGVQLSVSAKYLFGAKVNGELSMNATVIGVGSLRRFVEVQFFEMLNLKMDMLYLILTWLKVWTQVHKLLIFVVSFEHG